MRSDTKGQFEEVDAKYELLKRGQYEFNVSPDELEPMTMDSRIPIELFEARNAVRIAKWTGAKHYAMDSLDKAQVSLQNAEDIQAHRGNKKSEITDAREAVQTAEDARIITVKKIDEERQASELQVSSDAAALAKVQAAEAERQAKQADNAAAAAKAQTAQNQAESDAAATKAKADADQARATSDAALATAQAEAEKARLAGQQAETDKATLRAQLSKQLNTVLQTRDSARGLIVNMADVLFATAQSTLKPGAREKLSKVAGILLAYPGLKIEVDGHTDNVGSEEYNQTLSDQRAESVRSYLVAQGVQTDSVTAKGFGKTQPVGTNDTAEGRQMNRRVELVVSGAAIGAEASGAAGR